MSYVTRWRNKATVPPSDVKPGDGFTVKVVAVVYDRWWTAYCGPADWSDDRIAGEGDAIYDKTTASRLFWVLSATGLPYDVL